MQMVDLNWQRRVTTKLSYLLGLHFEMLPYGSANQGTLYNGNQSLFDYDFGAVYESLSRWRWEVLGGNSGYCFAPSYSNSTANLEVNNLLYLGSNLSKEIYHWRSYTLSVEGGAQYLNSSSAANYSISNGFSYHFKTELTFPLGKYLIFGNVGYQEIDLKTNLQTETYREITERAGLTWRF